MEAVLIVVTLVELAILVLVLAGYLIAIAATLRNVSQTLGKITFGVRAIEKQTDPIGPAVREINETLDEVAQSLEKLTGREPPTPPRTAEQISAER